MVMAMLFLAISVSAYDFEVDGNLFFKILSTSDLTCKLDSVNKNYEGVLIIPESVEYKGKSLTVTVLGSNCIRSCDRLTSITVHASVKRMEEGCFAYCSSIQSADIKQIDATILSKGCFKYSSIQNIYLPPDIEDLPDELFLGCRHLVNFDIPERVVNVGANCFAMTNLESISFPKSLRTLGKSAFDSAKISCPINLPEGLLEVGDYAFRYASLPSLCVSSTVSQLGKGVFESCEISKVEFSSESTLESLPEHMFYQSTLADIIFPPTLISVGDGCFDNCVNISHLDFPSTIETFGEYCLANLKLDSLILSHNINSLDPYCFKNTKIKNLRWEIPGLKESYFKMEDGKYLPPSLIWELFTASFDSIDKLEIGSDCNFLYLGWCRRNTIVGADEGYIYYSNFIFGDSGIEKLILEDSSDPIILGTVYYYETYGSGHYLESYRGRRFPTDAVKLGDAFLSSWMKSLKELYIGREIEGNPIYAPNLEKLTIGQVNKVDIENTPLPNLKSIECVSDMPPTISPAHFSVDQYVDLIVIVPDDAIENYRNADVWKNFWNITSKSDYEAGIEKILTDGKTELARYDLMGNTVTTNYHGLVIIKYSDGTISKRFISQ